jgi:hypothetical protein
MGRSLLQNIERETREGRDVQISLQEKYKDRS